MPYDYHLVIGALFCVIGLLHGASLMVDHRSPIGGLILFIAGAALVGWAWMLSDGELTMLDLPNSLFRILGAWIN